MTDFTSFLKKINWFYTSLLIFAVAFPLSESLISISIGLILITALLGGKKGRLSEYRTRISLLSISAIYLVYLISFLFCEDVHWGIYDLRKSLAYLIIPIAFILGNSITSKQFKRILILFVVAVVSSSFITLITYLGSDESSVLTLQKAGFIHHIRFGMQVNFAFIIVSVLYFIDFKNLILRKKITYLILLIYLVFILFLNQSITGLIIFVGIVIIEFVLLIRHLRNRILKGAFIFLLALGFLAPVVYVYVVYKKFYNVEEVSLEHLDKTTLQGNSYKHQLENKQLENANYVGLYICEIELKEAWDQRSEDLKIDDITGNGYPVRETLKRYLTSKGLRKDAEGVNSLSDVDLENIKKGISNHILASKRFTIYPRIYVSIWELDRYVRTGNANNKSLSQRIEYSKAAIHIIKQNFLFGVGTGDWKKAYYKAYVDIGSNMSSDRFGDAHNQYLNYMVKFGILGFLIIMALILYPVIKSKKYRNPIFLLFLLSIAISNFGDSNLETHVGGAFFVFFFCLFIVSDDWTPVTKKRY